MKNKKFTSKLLALCTSVVLSISALAVVADPISVNAATAVSLNKTNFPDDNFRSALKTYYDKNKDNQLSDAELKNIKRLTLVEGCEKEWNEKDLFFEVKNVKGVEKLTYLTYVDVSGDNTNTKLDFSTLKALQELHVSGCSKFSSLNVKGLTKLSVLGVYECPSIETIDVTSNTGLKEVCCSYSDKFRTLKTDTKNTKLSGVYVYGEKVSKLDVSKLGALKKVNISETPLSVDKIGIKNKNNITDLDVSYAEKNASVDYKKYPNLTSLYANGVGLKSIDLTSNKKIKYLDLSNNNLSKVDLSKLTALEYLNIHDNKSMTSVKISYGIERIGYSTFSGCSSLTSVTIPYSVKSIGDDAFSGCTSLMSVTIPNSVTSIGYGALGYYYNENTSEYGTIPNFTIKCCKGSAAEKYANDNDIKCEYISDSHTHTYSSDWTIDKAATCKAAGSKSHHCTICNQKTDVTATPKSTVHKYGSWKMTTNATTKTNGKQQRKCSVCGKTETRECISIARTKISVSNKTYTGSQIKPAVTVKYGKTTRKANTDYTMTYGTNKATGKGTVTITGKGKYVGKVTKTFKILPRKTTVSLKSSSRGKMTVSYTKKSEAVKYKIQYADNSKFKKATTKTVSAKTTKLTVSGKSGKYYYVRVSVVGKDGTDSGWSTMKKIKVK